VCVSVSVCVSS